MNARSYAVPVMLSSLYAILLAGCSAMTQSAANLPASSGTNAVRNATNHSPGPGNPPYFDLLKEQIDGTLPHYLPRKVLKIEYDTLRKGGKVPRVQRDSRPVAIWVGDQPSKFGPGYLFGIT
jgi:hypothetical protein